MRQIRKLESFFIWKHTSVVYNDTVLDYYCFCGTSFHSVGIFTAINLSMVINSIVTDAFVFAGGDYPS